MDEVTGGHDLEYTALMDKLRADLERDRGLNGKTSREKRFNNFYMRLPGGSSRNSAEMDLVGDISFGPKVRKGKTNREFFAEMDRIAIEENVSVDKIVELQKQLQEVIAKDNFLDIDFEEFTKLQLDITELALSVYARLLLDGYAEADMNA
jgi:hypothetical protein